MHEAERFKSLVKSMSVGILLQGPGAEILFSNPAALGLLGLSEDQLLGRTSFDPRWNVIHEDGSPFPGPDHPVPRAIKTGESVRNVVMGVFRPVSGDRVWLLVDAVPETDGDGKVLDVVCTFLDISERKKAEERVQGLLAEKEIILKEVHHRIKNNMSTICGLLSLQADAMRDPSVVSALKDAESRVTCMMMLYDRLYQSGSFTEASIGEYLPDLVDEIVGNFPGGGSVNIEKDVEDIVLDARCLSTIGIIVNELLTNIMKYAFAGRAGGRIVVSASQKGDLVLLTVQDDGVGMPESVDAEGSPGFGLTLVRLLADQLGGSMRIERDGGTRIILEFSRPSPSSY